MWGIFFRQCETQKDVRNITYEVIDAMKEAKKYETTVMA